MPRPPPPAGGGSASPSGGLARAPGRLQGRAGPGQVGFAQGDALRPDTLGPAMAGVTCAYYMIHSMQKASAGSSDFHERDQMAARHFSQAAKAAGVQRIIKDRVPEVAEVVADNVDTDAEIV